jgi:cell division septal protein FtsQ
MRRSYRRYFRVRAKIRQKRKEITGKFLKWTFSGAVICMLIFLSVKHSYKWAVSSDMFEVRKIDVTGLETISVGKFVESLPDDYKNNIILSYFTDFKSSAKRYFPQIKHISIKRKIPHTLRFKVVERKPIAYLRNKDMIYAVDDENYIFPLTSSIISLPEMRAAESDRGTGIEFINCLVSSNIKIYKCLRKLHVAPGGDILIYIEDGLKVIWGKFMRSEMNTKLKYLNDAMYDISLKFSTAEFIDLRLTNENRVIVKPIKKG